MVRVISEKLFSPPRSRHSSGETVDKELAARAVEVLSNLNSRRLELSDYESSSDSHWDSEVDVEEDCGEGSKDFAVGEQRPGGGSTDVLRKRKERRRERNKLSAQAYRVRRKEQTFKQQTVLQTLQEENSRLKGSVNNLEDQLHKVRHSLRQRGYLPSFPLAPSTTPTPTLAPSKPTTATPQADTAIPGSAVGGAGKAAAVFGQACGKSEVLRPAMDNDHSHKQQISPVVDNFLFSKSLAPTPTPSSGAPPTVTPSPPFSFPSSPMMGMGGGSRHKFSAPAFLSTPLPTISEKPDGPFMGFPHQHHPKPQQQQQADFNANANSTFALNTNNANTIHTNANVFGGMYQNNNNRVMNNNNQLFHQTVPMNGGEGGACVEMAGAQPGPFKMCKV